MGRGRFPATHRQMDDPRSAAEHRADAFSHREHGHRDATATIEERTLESAAQEVDRQPCEILGVDHVDRLLAVTVDREATPAEGLNGERRDQLPDRSRETAGVRSALKKRRDGMRMSLPSAYNSANCSAANLVIV